MDRDAPSRRFASERNMRIDAPPTPRAFALQELTACWNQGYEALVRGDVERVGALLDIAQDHVAATGDASDDSTVEAALRRDATASHLRLQHAIKAGLTGLQDELARTRVGGKALRGYGSPARVGNHVARDA